MVLKLMIGDIKYVGMDYISCLLSIPKRGCATERTQTNFNIHGITEYVNVVLL